LNLESSRRGDAEKPKSHDFGYAVGPRNASGATGGGLEPPVLTDLPANRFERRSCRRWMVASIVSDDPLPRRPTAVHWQAILRPDHNLLRHKSRNAEGEDDADST